MNFLSKLYFTVQHYIRKTPMRLDLMPFRLFGIVDNDDTMQRMASGHMQKVG